MCICKLLPFLPQHFISVPYREITIDKFPATQPTGIIRYPSKLLPCLKSWQQG